MIINTIEIGDKKVDFACSAGTLKRYRDIFGEDLFGQMTKLSTDNPDLDVLEKLAYVMARQAGETKEYEEWLDEFDLLDFLNAVPKISQMWGKNMQQQISPKKK